MLWKVEDVSGREFNDSLRRALIAACDGAISFDVPSSRCVTLRAGGSLASLAEPRSVESLRQLWSLCHRENIPTLVIGKGSNLLVSDDGFHGVVFRLGQCLGKIAVEGQCIQADAGAPLPALSQVALKAELSGSEWCVGIPGTVGGAIFMNAGCHQQETKDFVVHVESLSAEGEVIRRSADEVAFDVRTSCFQKLDELVLGARFKFVSGTAGAIREKMDSNLLYRKQTQPLSDPNCGSVFMNPVGHSAWKLIDECGLRGLRRGNAAVSEKHSNFIVNLGDATAGDVLSLIRAVQARVHDHSGVSLHPELRVIGAAANEDSPATL